MSKIYYKNGTARTVSDAEEAARKAAEQAAAEAAAEDGGQPEDIKEGENAAPAEGAPDGAKGEGKTNAAKAEQTSAEEIKAAAADENFDKDKAFKYFRRHPKNKINTHLRAGTDKIFAVSF